MHERTVEALAEHGLVEGHAALTRELRRLRGRHLVTPISTGIQPDLDHAALGAGYRAAEQQQVLVRADVHDLEPALGRTLVAHLAGAADALENAGGVGRGADRTGRADIVRAVRDRA